MAAIANWTPDRLPSLKGKTFAITGANSGIGYGAAWRLAEAGADLVLLCRSRERGEGARAELEAVGEGAARLILVDLASLASVRRAAPDLSAVRLDGLILNAGIMAPPKRKTTEDGFELQFGVNHLGHFLLAALVFPALKPGGRIVAVSSNMHKAGLKRIRFEDPHWTSGYKPMAGYAQSKLANALFIRELNTRLVAKGRAAAGYLCHPGYAATEIQNSEAGPFMRAIMNASERFMAQSADKGGWPTVLAAADPQAEPGTFYGPTGLFDLSGPVGVCQLAPQARNDIAAKKLWALSETATGHRWDL